MPRTPSSLQQRLCPVPSGGFDAPKPLHDHPQGTVRFISPASKHPLQYPIRPPAGAYWSPVVGFDFCHPDDRGRKTRAFPPSSPDRRYASASTLRTAGTAGRDDLRHQLSSVDCQNSSKDQGLRFSNRPKVEVFSTWTGSSGEASVASRSIRKRSASPIVMTFRDQRS